LEQTPINEEYVATKKIQKLLDEGNSVKEVGLIWNGSLGGTEEAVEKKGINRHGVLYDTTAYAKKVISAFNTIAQ
jgi:hypothetical protein